MVSESLQQNDDDDALALLSQYLAESSVTIDYPRQRCSSCSGSGSIYCPNCLGVYLPRTDWPESIANQTLRLPFELDILLDDRRASSTGVQVATVLQAAGQFDRYRLFDLAADESGALPDYAGDDDTNGGGTYLMFPDVSAIPLSSVMQSGQRIKRLIVMDCKWTKYSKTLVLPLHKSLANVPRIKLDRPPLQSFYWRWHNAGEGAVSTIEAIYYAACQVRESYVPDQPERRVNDMPATADDLLDLFWLFRLQRNIIANRYEQESFSKSRAVPFSAEAKEHRRALRRLHTKALPQQKSDDDDGR